MSIVVHHQQSELLAARPTDLLILGEALVAHQQAAATAIGSISKLLSQGAIEPTGVDFRDKYVIGRISDFVSRVSKFPICNVNGLCEPVVSQIDGKPLTREEMTELCGRNILPDEKARRACMISLSGYRKGGQPNRYFVSREHLCGLIVLLNKAIAYERVQQLILVKAEDAKMQYQNESDQAHNSFGGFIHQPTLIAKD